MWDWPAIKAMVLGLGIFGFLVLLFFVLSLILPPVRQLAHDVSSWIWGGTGEIHKLSQQTDDLNAQIERQKTELHAQDQEIARLQQELLRITAANDDLNKQVSDLKQRLADLQATKETTQADLNKLQQQVNDLQVQLNLKEQRVQNLLIVCGQACAPGSSSSTNQPNQPTSMNVLFFDDFNHGPSNGWSPVSGTWIGQAGGYTVNEGWSGDYYSYVAQGKTWENYAVDVDLLDINPNSRFGIGVRADGAGDLALFSVEGVDWYLGGWVCIRTVSSGVEQHCQEVPLRMSSQTHLRVEVIGNRIVAKVGGMKVGELTGGFPARGMPALHIVNADGMTFDNFKVTLIGDFSQ